MDFPNKFKKGFSLIEIIIVISIIAIFSSISVAVYNNFRLKNILTLTSSEMVQILRHAQSNSQANKNDSAWGIKISSNEITVFMGNNYQQRDPSFDQNFKLDNRLDFSGADEIVFEKLNGFTNNPGVIVLKNSLEEKNIEINEKGTIFY